MARLRFQELLEVIEQRDRLAREREDIVGLTRAERDRHVLLAFSRTLFDGHGIERALHEAEQTAEEMRAPGSMYRCDEVQPEVAD